MKNHPLIIECNKQTLSFFKDFDCCEFQDKLIILINFIENNLSNIESAKVELGESSQEFLLYSDTIYMMAARKFTELVEDCKSDEKLRSQLFEPVEDNRYGDNMWDQQCYILVNSSPVNDDRRWFMSNQANLVWTRPMLEFGQFKSKKSDSVGSEGCYIATMVYNDYNHPQVIKLRRFRDNFLLNNSIGVFFVKLYYKYSPYFVKRMKDYRLINSILRKILNTITYFLK